MKQVSDMTLDELLTGVGESDLPEIGGDIDTLLGWAERMGKGRGSATVKRAFAQLKADGLMTPVRCKTVRNGYRYDIDAWRCPTLAKLLAGKAGD